MVSVKCKAALEKPISKDLCYDFRELRRRAICGAWKKKQEEKIPFKEAMKASWAELKGACAKV